MFLSSFGGHPHEGLANRVAGMCNTVQIPLTIVDFVDDPDLRGAVPEDLQLPLMMLNKSLVNGGFPEFQHLFDTGELAKEAEMIQLKTQLSASAQMMDAKDAELAALKAQLAQQPDLSQGGRPKRVSSRGMAGLIGGEQRVAQEAETFEHVCSAMSSMKDYEAKLVEGLTDEQVSEELTLFFEEHNPELIPLLPQMNAAARRAYLLTSFKKEVKAMLKKNRAKDQITKAIKEAIAEPDTIPEVAQSVEPLSPMDDATYHAELVARLTDAQVVSELESWMNVHNPEMVPQVPRMNSLAQRQYLVQTFKEHTQQLVAKQRTKDAKAARRQLQQERMQVMEQSQHRGASFRQRANVFYKAQSETSYATGCISVSAIESEEVRASGIEPGDAIIEIGGKSCTGWAYDNVKNAMVTVPHPAVCFQKPSTGQRIVHYFQESGPLGISIANVSSRAAGTMFGVRRK